MWYDASSIGSPTNANGYGVTNWYDKTTSAFTLTQTGNGKQPYWTNSGSVIGGKPWLEFDGNNDTLFHLSGNYAQPITIFTLVNNHSNSSAFYIVGGTNNYGRLSATTGDRISLYSGTLLYSDYSAVTVNKWYLYEITHDGTSSVYTNGVSVLSGNAGTSAMIGLRVGAAFNDGSGWWPGGMAELIIYTNSVAAGDRTKIRNYFTGKYGAYASW